jgi:hypothetical protein
LDCDPETNPQKLKSQIDENLYDFHTSILIQSIKFQQQFLPKAINYRFTSTEKTTQLKREQGKYLLPFILEGTFLTLFE